MTACTGAYSSKTNTNNHKNKQRQGQTLTKLHKQRQAMEWSIVQVHILPKKRVKKTNTIANNNKYKTKQRQLAQVHFTSKTKNR